MCEACNHIATYQQLRQADPTKTNVQRATFVRDMDRRFNKIKKMIIEAVVTNDCFGLNPKIQVNEGFPKKAFQFSTNPEKVEKFMSWINHQTEQELLTVQFRSQLGQASQAPWTNMYISDSYKRGVDRAAYEAKKGKVPGAKTVAERGGIEAVMGTPIHMDRLGMLYTRTFTELKGITAAMDTQMSKVLAQGIADGDSPAAIARKLNKVIGGGLDLTTKTKAGIERTIPAQVRARTLARTEVIRAHHAATIQEYRNFGLAGVKVQAEWSTAGDDRVCAECASLEGKVYTLDEIEGLIPLHPNCRCIALPVLNDAQNDINKNIQPPTIVDDYDTFTLATANKDSQMLDLLKKPQKKIINGKEQDNLLHEIASTRGYTGKPTVVSASEFDEIPGNTLYRGSSARANEAFLQGEYYVGSSETGVGAYGNGYYFAEQIGQNGAYDIALEYAKGISDNVLSVKLAPGTKIISMDDLMKLREQTKELVGVNKYRNLNKAIQEGLLTEDMADTLYMLYDDPGRWAALQGYDGITTGGQLGTDYVILLNRTKAIVKN
jgi:SPP1 gp7 family putative phage head morphogenesis protein